MEKEIKKYLVLERDPDINTQTKKFFETLRLSEEEFEYELYSPKEEHSSVVHTILDQKPHTIVIAPTLYLSSDVTKLAHDILSAYYKNKEHGGQEIIKEIIIVDTLESFTHNIIWAGSNAMASVGGVMDRIPTCFIDEQYTRVHVTSTELFKILRPFLYGDTNAQFSSEYALAQIEKRGGNRLISFTKPDKSIPFVIIDHQIVMADRYTDPADLLIQFRNSNKNIPTGKFPGGFMDVFHGNRTLVFRHDNADTVLKNWDIDSLTDSLNLELSIFFPDYQIRTG
jgi:hypothetical protein